MQSLRLTLFAVLVLALGAACSPAQSPAASSPTTSAVSATKAPAAAATAPAAAPTTASAAAPTTVAAPTTAAAAPTAALAAPTTAPAATTSAGGAKPTVKIGSTNFSEQVILGELYGQALEAAGYTVDRRFNLGSREIVEPALESGQIDLQAEYLATMLAFVTKNAQTGTTDPAETAKQLQAALDSKQITVLDYAQAVDTNGFAVTKATADKYKLAKLSDLAAVASQLILGGAPECPTRPFCGLGLEKTYGAKFKDFKPLDVGGPLTVAALQAGQIDVGLLFTTDATISAQNLVLLADDKHLQLADNVAPVVRNDLLAKAPDLKTIVNAVTAKLTTEELTKLNKQVGVDRTDAKDAAAAWLKAQGLVK